MKITLCILVVALAFTATAQPGINWTKGVVVLSDRTVITGEISFEPSRDLVLVRWSGQFLVLPPHRIESFRFYDEGSDINRQFLSLPSSNQQYSIYEVVIQGEVKVLRKTRDFVRLMAQSEIAGYHFYVWIDHRLEPVHQFRSKVFPILLEQKPLGIRTFVTGNSLSLTEMRSILLIVKEFNRLLQEEPLASR